MFIDNQIFLCMFYAYGLFLHAIVYKKHSKVTKVLKKEDQQRHAHITSCDMIALAR